MSGNIRLAPGVKRDPVVKAVRDGSWTSSASRSVRSHSRPCCAIFALIQDVEGWRWTWDAFGGIPEKKAAADGTRRLLTLDEMTDAVQQIVNPGATSGRTPSRPQPRVNVNQADVERGALRPAQLAMFTSAVADTLTLNQVI